MKKSPDDRNGSGKAFSALLRSSHRMGQKAVSRPPSPCLSRDKAAI
jgi:hypothetical protein